LQSTKLLNAPKGAQKKKKMKWYIKFLRHYADFSGRAQRQEYWMTMLFNSIFALVLILLLKLVFQNKPGFSIFVYQSYSIALLLPSLAVVVRRLHDVGKSGWMFFILFIPIVGPIWLLILLSYHPKG